MQRWIHNHSLVLIGLLFLAPFILVVGIYFLSRWKFNTFYDHQIAILSVIDEKNVGGLREMVQHTPPSSNPPLVIRNVKYLCGFGDQCQGDKYVSALPPCSADYGLSRVYDDDKSTEFNKFIDWYWGLVWIETNYKFYGPFRQASSAQKPSYSFVTGVSLLGIRSCK